MPKSEKEKEELLKIVVAEADKLLKLVGDLVGLLMEHRANENGDIENTLKRYGFTDEQIREWYGIGIEAKEMN